MVRLRDRLRSVGLRRRGTKRLFKILVQKLSHLSFLIGAGCMTVPWLLAPTSPDAPAPPNWIAVWMMSAIGVGMSLTILGRYI